jgi:pimeloyl-ACP methyl ester carboxylesterase
VRDNRRFERIVLVHGAAHGAWCWEELVPLLEARGYEVSTLDLPGLGDDPTPQKDVTFAGYVRRVVDVVEAGTKPVLLLGHSMGGAPISQAAEEIPDSIGKLIYLAAILPRDGESMAAVGLGGDDSAARAVIPSDVEGAHGFDPALAPAVFYNSCDPATAARATKRLRLQADAPLATPLKLSPERWGRIPKTYIICTRDRALPTAQQHWMCERAPDVKKRLMETDHSPFYSDPVGLAEIIDQEARG